MNRQPRRQGNDNRRGGRRQGPSSRQQDGASRGSNTINSRIAPGMSVAVVQKQDQPTGRLTYGVVAETLTNSAVHHRGIKVRLTDGTVGRVQHIQDATGKFPTHVVTAVDDEDGTSAMPSRTLQLQDWIQLPSASHVSAAAGIDGDAADWVCGVCTFQNSGFLSACEMCNAPAPSIGS